MIRKLIPADMANFTEILNHILGVVFIIIVFALAYAYLKPHQFHKRRMVSTLLLKASYLLYLLVLLIIIYLSALVKDGLNKVFPDIAGFAFLVVLFVPTIGIFARKLGQFSKKREEYNYFFSVVNVLSIVAILVMYFIGVHQL
jgi:Kef-type K+ transport system membrane component KefB